MKKLRKKLSLAIISSLLMFSTNPIHINAASTELETRQTIYYPLDGTTSTLSDSLTLPSSTYQNGSISGNTLTLSKSLADSSFATSKTTVNIANNDYVWVFNYVAPSDASTPNGQNGGFAFSLHNDPTFVPEQDGDYGALGIYRSDTNVGLKNAISIEVDNLNFSHSAYQFYVDWKEYDNALSYTSRTPHIAFTDPQLTQKGVNLPHESVGVLPNPVWNNTNNTLKVSWTLTDGGATDAGTDNIYTYKYEYY